MRLTALANAGAVFVNRSTRFSKNLRRELLHTTRNDQPHCVEQY